MKRLTAVLFMMFAFLLFVGPSFADEATKSGGSTPMTSSATSNAYTEDQLMNLTVYNQEGKEIGKIEDVNLNDKTGEVNYVILGKGGVLGIGEKKFAIPVEAFAIQPAEGKATLLVAEDKLDTAPTRAEGMSDEEFKGLIDQHYGIAPEWKGGHEKAGEMHEMNKGEERNPEESNQ